MYYQAPLFSVGENAAPMNFTLAYNSRDTSSPGPLGWGFTHTFNQHLAFYPSSTKLIKLVDGTGALTQYYSFNPGTDPFLAAWPAEATGRITLSGSVYTLTALDGTITNFDSATGHWNSTTDRWGNAYTGTYTSGNLTGITDPEGRSWTLAYSSSRLTSITDPDSHIWSFGYDGTNNYLTKIADPLHTLAAPWRQLSYVTGYSGDPMQVLALVKDDAGFVLEGHEYDTAGRATSSFSGDTTSGGANAKSVVTLSYDSMTQTTVTSKIDSTHSTSSVFTYSAPAGRVLPTVVNGNCPSCGGGTDDYQSYAYDSFNRITNKIVGTGAEQAQTNYTYDCFIPTPTPTEDQLPACDGRLLTRADAVGKPEARTTTYAYNYVPPSGASWPTFVTAITQSSAAKTGQTASTTYTWNSTGTPETTLTMNQIGYQLPTDASATTYTTTTHFDAKHRLTEIDGPATNQKTTRAYSADAATDNGGRLLTESLYTSATAHLDTAFASYDIFGTSKSVTDPNSVITTKTTDATGRVKSVTSTKPSGDSNEPADYVTTYTFDTRDRLTDVILPVSLTTKTHYAYEDGTNRLTDTIRVDSSGNQRERLHLTLNIIGGKTAEEADACGTPAATCTTWTLKRSDSFTYDAHNRLAAVIHPDTKEIDYTYDSRGNLKTVKDENHSTANTTYAYDFLNRLTQVTQKQPIFGGPDILTGYVYDIQDNMTSLTDPNGNATTYGFDDFHRMQSQTSPVNGLTTYVYDPVGNLTSTTDARFVTTARTYDAANRITGATASGAGVSMETTSWIYDDATAFKYRKGRLSSMTDPSGSTTYSYERRGLLTSDGKTISGTLFTASYGYDANGNRNKVTYPSNRLVTYTFDFADRPVKAVSGATVYVDNTNPPAGTFAYQPFGPESWDGFGNGTTRTITFDNRYRPTENNLVKNSPLTTLADYNYGEDAVGNITTIADVGNASYNRTLGYDDLNRLTIATTPTTGTPPLWGTGSYSYDPMGNMKTATLGSISRTFSYTGTLPKLSSVLENTTSRPVTYDAAGNEISVAGNPSTYTARNFLGAADALTYTYDGRGLRTIVTSIAAAPTALAVDAIANGTSSNGNGILEPGEIVIIDPTWKNNGSISLALTGAATAFSGAGLTTSIPDNAASYGTIAAGASTDCQTATANCYKLTATLTGGTRSTTHIDAQFTETASSGEAVLWTMHVGNSFSDVPTSETFYSYIETIVHNGVTLGYGNGTYGPAGNVDRGSMAAFISRAMAGSDAAVPSSGTISGIGSYNCAPTGGTSLFTDVLASDTFCKHIHFLLAKNTCQGCSASPRRYFESQNVTRASMAGFMAEARVSPSGEAAVPNAFSGSGTYASRTYDCLNGPSPFTDVALDNPPGNDPACKDIGYIWALGIVDGFGNGIYGPAGLVARDAMAKFLTNAFQLSTSVLPGATSGRYARYFAYSPEMNLLEESSLTTGTPAPGGGYDYIWFNGHPIAEENGGTHWTLTDHLGTPILQTDGSGNVFWRPEYEPYGRIYAMRTAVQHQSLRLPGQEAEELNISGDGNGASERSYNIFRWYRAKWGRYTQADPLKSRTGFITQKIAQQPDFGYALANPVTATDALGLCTTCDQCPSGQWTYNDFPSFSIAFIGGFSVSWGAYTCVGKTNTKINVKTTCGLLGAIGVAGFGGDTNPYPTAACGCNGKDLLGDSSGSMFSFGPFTGTQIVSGKCGRVLRTGGFGRSTGFGGAYIDCRTEQRLGFWN